LPGAKIFLSFYAQLTFAARPVGPRHSDPVSYLEVVDLSPFLGHRTHNFMPGDEGTFDDSQEMSPISFGNVKIRMTHSAGFDFD
jgi:hypothetical protein